MRSRSANEPRCDGGGAKLMDACSGWDSSVGTWQQGPTAPGRLFQGLDGARRGVAPLLRDGASRMAGNYRVGGYRVESVSRREGRDRVTTVRFTAIELGRRNPKHILWVELASPG